MAPWLRMVTPVTSAHPHVLQRSRMALARSANRIALVWALRGTIATALPLLVLPIFGVGLASHFITIGALNTSMVDVGGSYRNRLTAMALNMVLSPCSLFLGTQARATWWLATLLMLCIAFGSGLARAFGPSATPLGLFVGIAFLIGTHVPAGQTAPVQAAALYCAGAMWTIAVTLILWRLRPFKRLEQEVAAVWESTAGLISAMRALEAKRVTVVKRRRLERLLAKRHHELRETVEAARNSLGSLRAEISGPGTTTAQLMILVRAGSRVAQASVALAEMHLHKSQHDRPSTERRLLQAIASEWEQACRAIATSLLKGRLQVSLDPMRSTLKNLTSLLGGTHPDMMAFAQAVRNLETAEEAANTLFGSEHHATGVLLPPLTRTTPPGKALAALRAQLGWQSAIFRHALRVAVASASATAIMIKLQLPHGLWLPMTTLVVLQPEFGGTLTRALQRTAGTIAGAIIAGLLLATLHGDPALKLVLIGLLAMAFFVQRRQHGLGVAFLTPLVVLLLAAGSGDPWADTLERIIDTAVGAAIGLAAGYLLWPQWERERVPDQMARAIRANRTYLSGVFGALSSSAAAPASLGELRRQAEIAAGNAEAAFQRLLAEPRVQRGRITPAFAVITYIQRLERHLIALAGQIGAVALPAKDVLALSRRLEIALEDVAAAVAQSCSPPPCPAFDQPLGRLREALAREETESGGTVAFLLGRVVTDATSLHVAATSK